MKNTIMILCLTFVFTSISVMGIQFFTHSRDTTARAIGGTINSEPNAPIIISNESEHIAAVNTQAVESIPMGLTNTNEKDMEIKLKHQQERLKNIEKRAGQKRQQVEDNYLRRCRELRASTEAMIRSLDSQEKQAWTELDQKLKHIITTAEKSTIGAGYIMSDGYVVGHDISKEKYETNVVGDPAREHAVIQQEIVEAKNETLASYEQELVRFQKQRQYELAKIDRWERQMKGYVSVAIRDITKVSQPETLGLVSGIMYSQSRPSALIGNRIIVHEGEIVHGVKILEIYKDKVLFEKDSVTWSQAIGDAPASHWK